MEEEVRWQLTGFCIRPQLYPGPPSLARASSQLPLNILYHPAALNRVIFPLGGDSLDQKLKPGPRVWCAPLSEGPQMSH